MNRHLKHLSLLIIGTIFFVACGKSNNNTCPAGQVMEPNNVCAVSGAYTGYGQAYGQPYGQGYGTTSCMIGNGQPGVQTASGCLPQGSCQPGYGYTGTTCIVGVTTGQQPGQQYQQCAPGSLMTNMGCLPQGQCQYGMAYSQQYGQCIPGTQPQGYGPQGYTQGAGIYFNYGYGANLGLPQQQTYCPMGMYYYNGGCYR